MHIIHYAPDVRKSVYKRAKRANERTFPMYESSSLDVGINLLQNAIRSNQRNADHERTKRP